jgi:hypothetical protein
MTRRKRTKISEKIRRGDGQGEGDDYKPFETVRSFKSRGRSSRTRRKNKSGIHHTFSDNETDYLSVLQICPWIIEIKDQVAELPQSETESIANLLGIKHPADPSTKENWVLTADFVITLRRGNRTWQIVRTIKESEDLMNMRTIEKLQIEYLYWQSRKIDWGIVTERELPPGLRDNMDLIWPRLSLEGLSLSEKDVARISKFLTERVQAMDTPLSDIANECDDTLGFEPGISLAVAYHLIAQSIWRVNLLEEIDPAKILRIHLKKEQK